MFLRSGATPIIVVLLALGITVSAYAQPSGSHPSLFQPLELAAPNDYRSASGAPGEKYWQQAADYHIRVSLDPASHTVGGTVTISYTNNGPEPIPYLWLQLDQNLFNTESRGAALQPPRSRYRGAFANGGFEEIGRVALMRDGHSFVPDYLIDDTRMRIALSRPLAPNGDQIQIEIDYAFVVPMYGADRLGRFEADAGPIYQVAQWYPRMSVYDDVEAWNTLPFLGQGEFYLEYGDFDIEITVPRAFVVLATGALVNADEVYPPAQRDRLEAARHSDHTVDIIGPADVGDPGTRPAGAGPLTWRFHASNVRDVAWAASPAFVIDGAGWNDVLIMSAYPAEAIGSLTRPGWERATAYGLHSIKHYADSWFPYPYPVAINVAGAVSGMEYPMIVFCAAEARGRALFSVTDHEFSHQWFPMIVGNDERRHAWMDEGFTTFVNLYSTIAFFGRNDPAEAMLGVSPNVIAQYMRLPSANQPITTAADRIRDAGLGFLAYRKPAAGLVLLREFVLGPERFDTAFRRYISEWAFKHPQPSDFFRTMEDAAGEDLAWFWRGWYMTTDRLDQAIADVSADGTVLSFMVENKQPMVMPAVIEIVFADGTAERRNVPVEVWAHTYRHNEIVFRNDVRRITIDPDEMLPDIDRTNNVWLHDTHGTANSASTGR